MVTTSSNFQAILDLITLERALTNGSTTSNNDIIVTSGDSIVGQALAGPAGHLLLTGGSSTGADGDGGNVVITVGTEFGIGTAGIVDINGDVDMDSDLTLAGLLTQPTGVVWVEQSAAPHTNLDGEGQVWVRDDGPNTLMFTDDTGADYVIGGALLPTSSPTFSTEGAPLDNLVAFVDIGDPNSYLGTGTAVTDFQGNLTVGTIAGAAYTNGALDFDGASGDLTFTKNATVDDIFSGGGAVMVFFRPRSDGEASVAELLNTGYDGSGYNLVLDAQTSGTVRIAFRREFATTDGYWRSNDVNLIRIVRLHTWHSIAIVYDDTTTPPTIYLDGKVVSLLTVNTPVGAATTDAGSPLILGNRAADDRTFDGNISTFLAWDVAATAETISFAHSAFMARHGSATGNNATTVSGGDLVLTGGDNFGGGSGTRGGSVFIAGGDGDVSGSADGGNVDIRSGNARDGGGGDFGDLIVVGGSGDLTGDVEFGGGIITSSNQGSAVLFRGTDNNAEGPGGDTIIRGGDARDGSGSDDGGVLALRSGQGRGNSGNGAELLIRTAGPSDGTGSFTGTLFISTQQESLNPSWDPLGDQGNTLTRTGGIFLTTQAGATATQSGRISIVAGNATGSGAIAGRLNLTAGSSLSTGVGTAGIVAIAAGTSAGGSNSPGGDIDITAGAQAGTGTGFSSPGGSLTLTAGDSNKNNASSGGGNVTGTAGNATGVAGPAGSVVFAAGDQTATGASGPAGDLTLSSGSITSGTSTSDAGDLTLSPGTNAGSGAAGSIILDYATWPAADGGASTVLTTNGAGVLSWASAGGAAETLQVTYEAGNTIVTSGAEGAFDVSGTETISLDAGAASNFTVASAALTLSTTTSGTLAITSAGILDLDSGVGSTSDGSALTLNSGAGDGAFDGGAVTIAGGDSGLGATGDGATVTVSGGDALSTNGSGGDIVLNPGSLSGTGADGAVIVNGKLTVTGLIDPTGLVLVEQASVPHTNTSGDGTLWVRDDAPNVLMFTDDTPVDHRIAYDGEAARAVYGDGSDGNVTISSNTALTRDMYYEDLTVNTAIRLSSNGYRVFVHGLLTLSGTAVLSANGTTATTTTAPTASTPGSIHVGFQGGSGGDEAPGSPGTNATDSMGAAGGAGGAGASAGGGAGGTATTPAANDGGWRDLFAARHATATGLAAGVHLSTPLRGGAGGGGGGYDDTPTTTGAAGGNGGDVVVLFAFEVEGTGTVEANGGGGADGASDDAGGGGGGGGGGVFFGHRRIATTITVQALGGAAGAGSGTGVGGTVGSPGTVIELTA